MRNLNLHRRPSKESEALTRNLLRELTLRQHGILICETCHFLADTDVHLRTTMTAINSITEMRNILQRGLSIHERLVSWSQGVPDLYKYTTTNIPSCCPEDPSEVYARVSIHLYSNMSVALLWDVHRITRILLLMNLKRCIRALRIHDSEHSATPNLLLFSDDVLPRVHSLIDDVCASVPFLLGQVDSDGNLRLSGHTKALGGLYLLFSLNTILFPKDVDPARKAWVKDRLTFIKYAVGIQDAVMD